MERNVMTEVPLTKASVMAYLQTSVDVAIKP
jgi:hypothetical protein